MKTAMNISDKTQIIITGAKGIIASCTANILIFEVLKEVGGLIGIAVQLVIGYYTIKGLKNKSKK